jgi:hypothetical protein
MNELPPDKVSPDLREKMRGAKSSAEVVSVIRANNRLTQSLVKAILMYTAQPLAGYNTFEQGRASCSTTLSPPALS